MTLECIFHDDKVSFYEVCKIIQREKIICKALVDRYAMAVCSCRRNASDVNESRINFDMEELQVQVLTKISAKQWEENNLKIITNYIHGLPVEKELNQSVKMFLKILSDAFSKDFTILESHYTNRVIKAASKSKKNMNANNYNFFIRKKKRKALIKAKITVTLFGGNTKYLEQDEAIGKQFSVIGKRFDCILSINGEETGAYMNKDKTLSVLNVWCNDRDSLAAASKILGEVAQKIQTIHSKPKRRVRHHVARVVNPGDSRKDYDAIDIKYDLSDNYELKKFKQGKNTGKKKVKVNVLKDGHCRHCRKTFDTLKGSNTDGDCQYHSGYVVTGYGICDYEWNCCGHVLKRSHPEVEDYSDNGCTTGRHLWVPYNDKKDSRIRKKTSAVKYN
ncbi:hypothetical protein SNE40_007870 [Patella caerulea]|uniref:Uncharacterized protein n=1 Tax=Patella caerulea TaxID=87958 RepID=A0AAN8K048_PATCE